MEGGGGVSLLLNFPKGGLTGPQFLEEGSSKISTPPELAVGTSFHAQHGIKTTLVFFPADEEASWLLVPSSVSLLSGGTVQPENTYSCILQVKGQVC